MSHCGDFYIGRHRVLPWGRSLLGQSSDGYSGHVDVVVEVGFDYIAQASHKLIAFYSNARITGVSTNFFFS